MIRIAFKIFIVVNLFACSQKITPPEPILATQMSQTFPDSIKAVMIETASTLVGPCEPSICIDPTNANRIVAGSILDIVYTSSDGGHTWSKDKLRSSYGVYGDPVIVANYKGDFFYAHLSNPDGKAYASESFLDRIVVQKSSDGGNTWNDGSYTLPRSPKDQDKQWMAVDPNDNTIYMTWTEFDLYDSALPEHKSRILFAKSTDDGDSWTDPLAISQFEGNCLDGDQTTEGAVPCVGPDGQIYVAWSYDEKIYFDKSYDKGVTWMNEDIVISDQPGGWEFDIPGIIRCNGMPITCVDRSSSRYNGRIYVNWSDQRNGEDDTDIWVASSSDEGMTWSDPIRVNNDVPGKQQFLTWMDVDQSTGYIYIVFYDRRAHDDNATDVYVAVSKDGGVLWENKKVNSESFTPIREIFFGDYNDISAVDGIIRPIWTQLDGWRLSIWTAIVGK